MADEEPTILEQLDAAIPAPLANFDAFPKLPSTYKSRSESRGLITIFAIFIAFLLILNDLGEFVWGWPDYEFSVDNDADNFLHINVDMVVNMPCKCEYALQIGSNGVQLTKHMPRSFCGLEGCCWRSIIP